MARLQVEEVVEVEAVMVLVVGDWPVQARYEKDAGSSMPFPWQPL